MSVRQIGKCTDCILIVETMFEFLKQWVLKNQFPFTDSHAPLLSLQRATGVEAWKAFCHHTKLNMEEEFWSNWMKQREQDHLLTDAFEEAKTLSFDELLKIRQDIAEKNWGNVLLIKYEKIVTFVVMHHNSMNITLDVEEVFQQSCEKGPSELAKFLFENAAFL